MKAYIKQEKGFGLMSLPFYPRLIIVIIIALLIVPLLTYAFPIAKYIVLVLVSFWIYELVARSLGGTGFMTILITGILIYFLVYKYLFLTATAAMFYLFISLGLFSTLIFGGASVLHKRPKQ